MADGARARARSATCAGARCPTRATSRPLAVHRVAAGDRLDLIAARYLGDPTAAWQIADANAALDPDELTGAGGRGRPAGRPVPGRRAVILARRPAAHGARRAARCRCRCPSTCSSALRSVR